MAERVRYPFNREIQWFHPPLLAGARGAEPATSSVTFDADGAITGLDPDLWATELRFLLDRVRSSAVGRAVVQCVRRRTTIYPGARAQTDIDPTKTSLRLTIRSNTRRAWRVTQPRRARP